MLLCFILHYSLPNFLLLLHFRLLNMQKVLMLCRKKPAIHHLKFLFMNFSLLFIPSLNQICNCHLQFLIKYSNYTNFKKCPKVQVILPAALLLLFLTWILLWAINEIVHHLTNWTDWLKILLVSKESILGELTWNLFQVLQPALMTIYTNTLCLSIESKYANLSTTEGELFLPVKQRQV